jgi:hypothetical protein
MATFSSKHATHRSFPVELLPVRFGQVVADVVLFAAALVISYLIRFEGDIPAGSLRQLLALLPYIVGARFLVNAAFGIYRIVWLTSW